MRSVHVLDGLWSLRKIFFVNAFKKILRYSENGVNLILQQNLNVYITYVNRKRNQNLLNSLFSQQNLNVYIFECF